MFKVSNFWGNHDVIVKNELGTFKVIEYVKELSLTPQEAQIAYFSSKMNVRKRQVICDVEQTDITLQAGAMQWTVGDVSATTSVKGVGDFSVKL
ncbi:hypothetical protein [Vagococcus teuberi]